MGRNKVAPEMLRLALSLFLVLSCLTVLCAGIQRSLTIEEENLEKGISEHEAKQSYMWLKKNSKELAELITNTLGSVPAAGAVFSSLLKIPLKLIPQEDKLKGIQSEMTALNTRLDIFYEELKWASNDFQKILNDIDHAWLKYKPMKNNANALKSIFCPFYSQYADSVSVLHKLLISKPETGEQSLADVLAKKLRCHEKDLEAKFLYLRKLVCRGNEMVKKCYELMGVDKSLIPDPVKMLQQSNSALFKTQQSCVSNSKLYIKRDIIERINDEIVHKDIANNIYNFLKEKYDRYDWLVVAFTTHFSKGMGRILKRHVYSGFTAVQRGSVTVAVARQLTGSHKNIEYFKRDIGDHFRNIKIECRHVEDELLKMNITNAITAVHVYKRAHNNHGRQEKEEEEEEEEEDKLAMSVVIGADKAYTVSGECKRRLGKPGFYTIMIKSDEEVDNKNPCVSFKCENGGKCEVVPRTNIPMCLCTDLFYGRRCENKITCDVDVTDNRRQTNQRQNPTQIRSRG
ncbi:hypothetical protein NL108_014571 [Boleophthalmus pectinirostris]|uniref:SE-cephalotoxin-like n=1 Tax=Boleophthalmus pectinirostris TaxID=150288 RepID=UPI00242B28F8|nr:SE-cephalotoxin-like [Boleophthalmus pectinirostris]KAJ0059886.1 hypothetical protein NL108_014571 [Boleophthalmus pectinirostris]